LDAGSKPGRIQDIGIGMGPWFEPMAKQSDPRNCRMKRLQTQNFHEPNPPQAFVPPDSLPRIHKWRAGSDPGTRAPHLTSKGKKESRKMTSENANDWRPSLQQVSHFGTPDNRK
jgi:hypothetical protein